MGISDKRFEPVKPQRLDLTKRLRKRQPMSLEQRIREILKSDLLPGGVAWRRWALRLLPQTQERFLEAIMQAIEEDKKTSCEKCPGYHLTFPSFDVDPYLEPEWPGRFNEDDWREER